MSQWGKLDYKTLTGTASVVQNSINVVCTNNSFTTANVRPGDALLIANVKYRVAKLANATTIFLSNAYTGTTASGLNLAVQQSPKDLLTYGQTSNVNYDFLVSKRNVFGVDKLEAQNPDNKAKGINSPGWVHYKTWTNTQGSTRHRAETLVAMSKNFNSNAAPALQTDAPDDATIPDYGVTVSTVSVTKLGNTSSPSATYTATGTVIPSGPSPTYTWQFSPNNIVWVGLLNNNSPVNTGNATSSVTIANIYATANVINGYVRVVVGAAGTTDTATSAAFRIVAGS